MVTDFWQYHDNIYRRLYSKKFSLSARIVNGKLEFVMIHKPLNPPSPPLTSSFRVRPSVRLPPSPPPPIFTPPLPARPHPSPSLASLSSRGYSIFHALVDRSAAVAPGEAHDVDSFRHLDQLVPLGKGGRAGKERGAGGKNERKRE